MKTLAAIMYEHHQPVVVEEVDLDPPKEGEVLVKMGTIGVCHSDLSVVTGTIYYDEPTVLGHEGAGTVVELGKGVTRAEVGDRVMLTFITPCGECFQCKRGRPNICHKHWRGSSRGFLFEGTPRFHSGGRPLFQMTRVGCMSEYTVVSEKAVITIDDDVTIDRAALVGCGVMTGVGAVLNTAKLQEGSTAAVVGVGGVGINVVQGCRLAGASMIVAVDLSDERLEWAKQFGATHTINPTNEDPLKKIIELTDEIGVDYAFEVIGKAETIEIAFNMLSHGGYAVVVGLAHRKQIVRLPAQNFVAGERSILGCMYGSSRMYTDMPRMLDLYRDGQLNLDDLISRNYRLEEINEAFAEMEAGRGLRGVIKFED